MMALSHRLPFLVLLGLFPSISNALDIVGGASPAEDKLVDGDGQELQVDLAWRSFASNNNGRALQAQPVCVFTLTNGTRVELDEGESFGNLLNSPCGPSANWPCFCDSSEDDLIRCPYCPFYTGNRNIVCARSGESISFLSEFGFQETCTCEYLGNNEIDTFCDPSDIPSEVCALQSKTEQCDTLTQFINFDPDCNCLSFCAGQFSNCCDFGESCTVSCPPGATREDIVSGCSIDPLKPPVSAPPVAPSPPPAPQSCMLELNTQNCPTFMANLPATLPSSCGPDSCYNFCDDQVQGCCVINDPTCAVQCTGVTEAVITAGCQRGSNTNPVPTPTNPPATACALYNEPCQTNLDCCSDRCFIGFCARPMAVVDTRTKLSGTRGGAGGVVKEGNRQLLVVGDNGNKNNSSHKSKIRGM